MLDPRGPRFNAAITTVVMVVVLASSSGWLALAQAVVFGLTALRPSLGPYSLLYRYLVRPRLSPPGELEDANPVRFAQLVGFVFALAAAVGYLSGVTPVGIVFAAFALGAAFLNAAFGFCLGCEMYLTIVRLRARMAGS